MSSQLFLDLLNGFKDIAIDINASDDTVELINDYISKSDTAVQESTDSSLSEENSINLIDNLVDQPYIKETINKENFTMNFQTILEELDRLYEEDVAKAKDDEVAEEAPAEEEVLTEAAEEDEAEEAFVEDEEAPTEDEPVEEEPAEELQLVLECANCGGLVVKVEADVTVDEETDLANADEACQYCEATEGYKIIGTLAPYGIEDEAEVVEVEDEVMEDNVADAEADAVEEGLFGVDMPIDVDIQANGNNVPFLNA